ncbi:unnamed protein product [Sphenostylis stenocarpa]|uniref:Tify domain-containing protein n=1 Tax=Sphenostylis stenocarpa TaxID=92480 RepID=A0AA87B9L9_9FABA|nr:unnamed protein product [Sphenostylis stenocarpa]
MANDTDSTHFVEFSRVRTGLKREFTFAMKVQSEICGSLGRTRSNSLSRKRSKKSSLFESKRKNLTGLTSLVKSEDDIGDVLSKEEAKSDVMNAEKPKCQVGGDEGTISVVCEKVHESVESIIQVRNEDEMVIPFKKENNNYEPKIEMEQIKMVCDNGGVKEEVVSDKVPSMLGCELKSPKIVMLSTMNKVENGDNKVKSNNVEKEGKNVVASASRKISMCSGGKKFPLKLKDLLSSGILEGLLVKYVRGIKAKSTGLLGVISGVGILCYCEICNKVEVVTPTIFELHAGSANKRPPEYIFLENGHTLRDIMNTFLHIPLDKLEEVVQKMLGGFTMRKSMFSKSIALSTSLNRGMKHNTSNGKSQGKLTRKDLRLHKLVFEEDGLPDGTQVAYHIHGKVSPSQFEAHAGWASRRKPYVHILISNGLSLHELSISLSKGRKVSTSDNDDLCSICRDGGNLLCCDGCPRAFHIGEILLFTS